MTMIKESYPVKANDMTFAGDVSARIKRQMKQLGIPVAGEEPAETPTEPDDGSEPKE